MRCLRCTLIVKLKSIFQTEWMPVELLAILH